MDAVTNQVGTIRVDRIQTMEQIPFIPEERGGQVHEIPSARLTDPIMTRTPTSPLPSLFLLFVAPALPSLLHLHHSIHILVQARADSLLVGAVDNLVSASLLCSGSLFRLLLCKCVFLRGNSGLIPSDRRTGYFRKFNYLRLQQHFCNIKVI